MFVHVAGNNKIMKVMVPRVQLSAIIATKYTYKFNINFGSKWRPFRVLGTLYKLSPKDLNVIFA